VQFKVLKKQNLASIAALLARNFEQSDP